MKFHPRYTPTIMDGPVIRWEGGYNRGSYRDVFSSGERVDWSGEISASRNGVCVSGDWPTLSRQEDVEAFGATMRKAFDAHLRIAAARDRDAHDVAKTILAEETADFPGDRPAREVA